MRIVMASIEIGGKRPRQPNAYDVMKNLAMQDLGNGGSEILPSWHAYSDLRFAFIDDVRRRGMERHIARSYIEKTFLPPNNTHVMGLAACMEQRGAPVRQQNDAVIDFIKDHWDALNVKERAQFLEKDRAVIHDWTVKPISDRNDVVSAHWGWVHGICFLIIAAILIALMKSV